MTGKSHKQAIKLIHRCLDGSLTVSQTLSLDEHLLSCDTCRAYSNEMDLLPIRLQNEFHLCWDKDLGPSQKVIEQVMKKARNIPMKNRISSGVRIFAGFTALIVLGFLVSFVVSKLQDSFMLTTATEPANNSHLEEDRLLAFTSAQNGNLDIYTMRPDGSELTNLTDNPANDFNPFWSSDGERIAFESDRDGSVQIFLMGADGSNLTQLTDGEADHMFRSANPWSPDGSKLTFTESAPGEEKWVLFVMDADGQNKIQLGQTPDIYGAPSWSPDGEHIAFVLVEPQENRDMAHIYVVDTDGSNLANVMKLLPEDEDLTSWNFPWAADGGSIFFVAGRFAWVTNSGRFAVYEASLDGNKLTEIVTYPDRIDDWWDGTALVQGFEGPLTLAWVRSDGTTSTLKPFENCQTREMMSATYKRSVNGSLLYGAQCDDGDLWLYSINSDGTLIKQLLDSPITVGEGSLVDISWSPDDAFIAFTVAFPDKTEMYVLNVNDAINNPSIQSEKYVVGGPGFISYNISWQPQP
jgi:Tol biopolymer transport system component